MFSLQEPNLSDLEKGLNEVQNLKRMIRNFSVTTLKPLRKVYLKRRLEIGFWCSMRAFENR